MAMVVMVVVVVAMVPGIEYEYIIYPTKIHPMERRGGGVGGGHALADELRGN